MRGCFQELIVPCRKVHLSPKMMITRKKQRGIHSMAGWWKNGVVLYTKARRPFHSISWPSAQNIWTWKMEGSNRDRASLAPGKRWYFLEDTGLPIYGSKIIFCCKTCLPSFPAKFSQKMLFGNVSKKAGSPALFFVWKSSSFLPSHFCGLLGNRFFLPPPSSTQPTTDSLPPIDFLATDLYRAPQFGNLNKKTIH